MDKNNQNRNINASDVDSLFIDNVKHLPVLRHLQNNETTVFARVFEQGYFSLLRTIKSNNEELIFWEKDSTALFLNYEPDFNKFREKVFSCQKLELVRLINAIDFDKNNQNFANLLKITKKMNQLYFPNEVVKVSRAKTSLGFYFQGGLSSSDILYQTQTTNQVAYENFYGFLGSKNSKNFGAFIQINPRKKLTIEFGLWHLKYENQKLMTIRSYTYVDTLHMVMERYSIPINVRYNFRLKKENIFFLKVGPQFNITPIFDSWIIPNYSTEKRRNLVKKNTDNYGFNLGLGYSKNINNLSLAIEYRYSYAQLLDGVTNIGKHYTNGVYLNLGLIQKK